LHTVRPVIATCLLAPLLLSLCSADSHRLSASTLSPTARPWPTPSPSQKQGARTTLKRFSYAVVHHNDAQAKHYLAPGFQGECFHHRFTHPAQPIRVILCSIPSPIDYRVGRIESFSRSGTLVEGLVVYRFRNGTNEPMRFVLKLADRSWRIWRMLQ
jgi:hypothetical protein